MTGRKKESLILMAIILLYTLIGHLFQIELLKIITITVNSFTVSIIGLIICAVTFILAKAARRST